MRLILDTSKSRRRHGVWLLPGLCFLRVRRRQVLLASLTSPGRCTGPVCGGLACAFAALPVHALSRAYVYVVSLAPPIGGALVGQFGAQGTRINVVLAKPQTCEAAASLPFSVVDACLLRLRWHPHARRAFLLLFPLGAGKAIAGGTEVLIYEGVIYSFVCMQG